MKKYFYLLASFCLLSFSPKPSENTGNIFLSRDQGESWVQRDSGFPAEASVNAMILSSNTVLIGTAQHGIYLSDDGLKSWHASNEGLPSKVKINALALHQDILFAGTYGNGIYISYNNGSSWEQSNHGLGNLTVRCFYSVRSIVFAGTDDAIYQSYDRGKTWSLVMLGTQINAFTSYHGILFAATSHGALRSEDSGKTWSWVARSGALSNIAADGETLVSITPDDRILLATDQGLRQWANLDFNFGQYTFRITPSSSPLLIALWRNEFKSLRTHQPFQYAGLPEKTSFSKILATPYGVLVAVSYASC